jgi:predicted  nucleic acid-binding Zn-ribbon protein
MDLKLFEKLKADVEKAQRESDRAEGVFSNLMERLRKEHDCETLEDAAKKVEDLKNQLKKADRSFDDALDNFEEKWQEIIGE